MKGSKRTACVGMALLVMLSLAAMTPGIAGAQESATTTEGPSTPTVSSGATNDNSSGQMISVRQVEDGTPTRCVAVEALGDGTQSVEQFYGYEGSPDVSGVGSSELQYSDTSQLMFYNGSEGLSVVVMHDKYADRTAGGDANMTFIGLPDGTWTVRDDSPGAEFSADEWNNTGTDTGTEVMWEWGVSRTDGAAYRTGGSFAGVTIVPEFNESDTNIRAWGLRDARNDSLIRLDMDRNVTFSAGACPEVDQGEPTEQPTPTISGGSGGSSGSSDSSGNGDPVSVDNASGENNTTSGVIAAGPQAFLVTNLTADRTTVGVNERINITATVENQADQSLARNIVLRTSENSTTERAIELGPGEQQFVQFQRSYSEPGSYTLRAGAATLDITVTSSSTGPGFGILPVLGALGVLVIGIVARRRTGPGVDSDGDGNDD